MKAKFHVKVVRPKRSISNRIMRRRPFLMLKSYSNIFKPYLKFFKKKPKMYAHLSICMDPDKAEETAGGSWLQQLRRFGAAKMQVPLTKMNQMIDNVKRFVYRSAILQTTINCIEQFLISALNIAFLERQAQDHIV